MRRIIHNEFISQGYYPLEESEGLVYYKHNDFDDFWIVCYNDFDLGRQSELYEQYLTKFVSDYPMIKKNTSLLIVAKEYSKSAEEIVAIENDPFFYKKYYLPYSSKAVEDLYDLLQLPGGEMKSIGNLMVDPQVFAELKSETKRGKYHLLYVLAHKLPFLPIHVNHERIVSTELSLNAEQEGCLRWCMNLSDDKQKRKSMIMEYSKKEG